MSAVAAKRGGVTPFNVLPVPAWERGEDGSGTHGARTPSFLCDWWARFICPPSGRILDPFAGSGTTGIAALRQGCGWVGIEKMEKYCEIAAKRLEAEPVTLFDAQVVEEAKQ